ncbi:hypothetical protein BE08_34865 [Sorangium cellulosum]|uniref:Uncharacterized protein n=1 Tax=Sorangium cellulosum TaxID=56 RepID=A0A150NYU4_SORCE|nr:hypothetical protein BE08_34865 [Sorangium cellulosum]
MLTRTRGATSRGSSPAAWRDGVMMRSDARRLSSTRARCASPASTSSRDGGNSGRAVAISRPGSSTWDTTGAPTRRPISWVQPKLTWPKTTSKRSRRSGSIAPATARAVPRNEPTARSARLPEATRTGVNGIARSPGASPVPSGATRVISCWWRSTSKMPENWL